MMSGQVPEDFRRFRAERDAELIEPYGWLTLSGYYWLPSEPSPLPDLPGLWWAEADQSQAHHDDQTLSAAEYARVPWVEFGDRQVELLRRGGRLAIRVRAKSSPDQTDYRGVPLFEYDEGWVVTGQFTSDDDDREVEVASIRADLRQLMHPSGEVSFPGGGQEQRLAVTKGKYGWGVEFHDPTNGEETEQWRQLHFDPPGPDGVVRLDFNRALNMWFAFTDHATCPAPIEGNVITVPVRAGEKKFRAH